MGLIDLRNMSMSDYQKLLRKLKRLANKACRRYKVFQLCNNPVDREDIIHDVCVNALLKAVKAYNKKKSSFSTYFFYKASSLARVTAIKIKHRYNLLNTFPLNEDRIC